MAISFADNIKIQGKKQNVERDSFLTIADMAKYSTNYLPDIFTATCKETGKIYMYQVGNEVDPVLGKWREYKCSGTDAVVTPLPDGGTETTTTVGPINITITETPDGTQVTTTTVPGGVETTTTTGPGGNTTTTGTIGGIPITVTSTTDDGGGQTVQKVGDIIVGGTETTTTTTDGEDGDGNKVTTTTTTEKTPGGTTTTVTTVTDKPDGGSQTTTTTTEKTPEGTTVTQVTVTDKPDGGKTTVTTVKEGGGGDIDKGWTTGTVTTVETDPDGNDGEPVIEDKTWIDGEEQSWATNDDVDNIMNSFGWDF